MYEDLFAAKTAARAGFRRIHPRRHGRRFVPYPPELAEMATFPDWLRIEIDRRKNEGEEISEDVEDTSNTTIITSNAIQEHVRVRVSLSS